MKHDSIAIIQSFLYFLIEMFFKQFIEIAIIEISPTILILIPIMYEFFNETSF